MGILSPPVGRKASLQSRSIALSTDVLSIFATSIREDGYDSMIKLSLNIDWNSNLRIIRQEEAASYPLHLFALGPSEPIVKTLCLPNAGTRSHLTVVAPEVCRYEMFATE